MFPGISHFHLHRLTPIIKEVGLIRTIKEVLFSNTNLPYSYHVDGSTRNKEVVGRKASKIKLRNLPRLVAYRHTVHINSYVLDICIFPHMQVCKEFNVAVTDHPSLSSALRGLFSYYYDLSFNDKDSEPPASNMDSKARKGLAYLSSPYE